MSELSLKQREQLGYYEYKGYEPERPEGGNRPEETKPLPEDVANLFNTLNTTGLSYPRDPLCCDLNYTKGKSRWLVSVIPQEKRIVATPKRIEEAYQKWYVDDWKQRSRISKIFSILWYLPSHFYRKYLSSLDYRFYYNGLMTWIGRARNKNL